MLPRSPSRPHSARRQRSGWLARVALLGLIGLGGPDLCRAQTAPAAPPQDALVVRPGPPARDDLETDADGDGIPDGWYNLRDAALVPTGGAVGPACVRFTNTRPGRPSRISRAFGIDGRTTEAIVIGLSVRTETIGGGERISEGPSLMIDFLGPELTTVGRGAMGPWTRSAGVPERRWVRVAKRISVPESTRDAILNVGLLGGTGTMEVDGFSFELIPRQAEPSTNLILNGDLELGDPDPAHWEVDEGVRRVTPGHDSASALELNRSGAQAQVATAGPLGRAGAVELTLWAKPSSLRGGGGAVADIFFLGSDGEILPGKAGAARLIRFSGSSDWRLYRARTNVPSGAVRAVLQIEKTDGTGSLRIDDVALTTAPDASLGSWTPYHVQTDTDGWHPYPAAATIEPGSALDFSGLLQAPAGTRGRVLARDGRLHFEQGGRARFFGVALLPPLALEPAGAAERLADQLARRGVNLARFDALDAPLGPGRSLIEDAADDTIQLDAEALDRFDHLIGALKDRGLYAALELLAARRFRTGDGVSSGSDLPAGGGPAAGFDPKIRTLVQGFATAVLGHVNPVTGLALASDPALAWVALTGEVSLFDLIDDAEALPESQALALRTLARKAELGNGRRFWQQTESNQWKTLAESLRRDGLKAPLAGGSHWRREPEFNAVQTAPGLDLIDDRLYWPMPRFAVAEHRAMVRNAGVLRTESARKRKADRPYVVGQWAHHTGGAWAAPYEGADLLLASAIAATEDWDGLVRRGVMLFPEVWGAGAPGTAGGPDVFQVPEVLNANPAVFALLPHAASVFLRPAPADASSARPAARGRDAIRGGSWDPALGRLVIDTPHTKALAGWAGRPGANFAELELEHAEGYAVLAVSAPGLEPIAKASRLLVTALARFEPTGLRYADSFGREVADPGMPPLRAEPVRGSVLWKRPGGRVKAYALDSAGKRVAPVELEATPGGVKLVFDGRNPALHYELVDEPDPAANAR